MIEEDYENNSDRYSPRLHEYKKGRKGSTNMVLQPIETKLFLSLPWSLFLGLVCFHTGLTKGIWNHPLLQKYPFLPVKYQEAVEMVHVLSYEFRYQFTSKMPRSSGIQFQVLDQLTNHHQSRVLIYHIFPLKTGGESSMKPSCINTQSDLSIQRFI